MDGSACRRPRPPASARSGWTAGCRSRWPTSAGPDVLLLVGANPADTMPPLARYFTDLREHGGELVVVDPRRTATARRATLHLQPTPGTDLALANALVHLVIAEGRHDRDFIAARTSGFDDVARTAASYWPSGSSASPASRWPT
jgi:anaerobic selenocysteine-containing dehydrogenase